MQCGYCINGMIMESAAFLAGNKNPTRGARSRRRSPTTSAAAAPTPASCARSSAPPAKREGGNHDQAFQSVTPRPPQGRRRAHRQLLARRRASTLRSRKAPRRNGRWRSTEVDAFLAIDATRPRHGLFRQGRSRHRRHAPRSRRWPPTSSTCRSARCDRVEGDTALTPDQGKTWGSLTIQARRHADPQRGGDRARGAARAGRQAPRRQARRAQRRRRRHPRRQPPRQLWRADRRQDVLAQARPRQAGQVQGPEGLQDRRQVGAARRHPGQGDRALHLHQQFPRAAACCTAA